MTRDRRRSRSRSPSYPRRSGGGVQSSSSRSYTPSSSSYQPSPSHYTHPHHAHHDAPGPPSQRSISSQRGYRGGHGGSADPRPTSPFSGNAFARGRSRSRSRSRSSSRSRTLSRSRSRSPPASALHAPAPLSSGSRGGAGGYHGAFASSTSSRHHGSSGRRGANASSYAYPSSSSSSRRRASRSRSPRRPSSSSHSTPHTRSKSRDRDLYSVTSPNRSRRGGGSTRGAPAPPTNEAWPADHHFARSASSRSASHGHGSSRSQRERDRRGNGAHTTHHASAARESASEDGELLSPPPRSGGGKSMRPPSGVPPSSSSRPSTTKPLATTAALPSSAPTPTVAPKVDEPPTGPEAYETLAQVGEGTYGKVFRARQRRTGTLVALKRVRIEATRDGFPITAVRELQLLQRISSANVVSLLDIALETTTQSGTPSSHGGVGTAGGPPPMGPTYVYMVFEYMQHDLAGILHHPNVKFSLAHVKSLVQQLLLGLAFLHTRGIVHRDVKGSNLLLNRSGQLKLADFGLARAIVPHGQSAANTRAVDLTNRVITLWYRPPELLLGGTHYGGEVDLWSTGCILLELFAARPAFPGTDEIHQLDLVFRTCGTPQASEWPEVENLPWWPLVRPQHAKPRRLLETFEEAVRQAFPDVAADGVLELIDQLLQVTPHRRPTAEQALGHKWFTTELPKPEAPKALLEGLDDGDHWHEFESKQRKRAAARAQQQQQQQQQQAAGSTGDLGAADTPSAAVAFVTPVPASAAPGSPVHVVTSVRLPKVPLAEPLCLASKLALSVTPAPPATTAVTSATRQAALNNMRRSFVPTMPLISLALQKPAVTAPPPPPPPVEQPPLPVAQVVKKDAAAAQQAVTPSSPGTPAVNLSAGGGGGSALLPAQARPTSVTASVQVKPGGIVVRQVRPSTVPPTKDAHLAHVPPPFDASPPELALRVGMMRSPPPLPLTLSSSMSVSATGTPAGDKRVRPSPRPASTLHAGPSLASVLGFPLPPVSASQANSPVVGVRSPPPTSSSSSMVYKRS